MNTDGSGNFSTPFTVQQNLSTNNGPVDCEAVVQCIIAVSDGDGTPGTVQHFGSTNIYFAPVFPDHPVGASPNVDVPDGTTVNVASLDQSWPADTPLTMTQCAGNFGPGTPQQGCDASTATPTTTDGNGGFSADFVVHRYLQSPTGPTDCRMRFVCQIFVTDGTANSGVASVSFAGDPWAIQVSPDTNLVNGQLVNVTGQRFPPNGQVAFWECQAGSNPGSGICNGFLGSSTFPVDQNGNVDADVPVFRSIGGGGGGAVDCTAPNACTIVAQTTNGFSAGNAQAPLQGFNPAWPPIGINGVGATTNLYDGQPVTIHGQGFSPGVDVRMMRCGTQFDSFQFCANMDGNGGIVDPSAPQFVAHTDGNGAFTLTFPVPKNAGPNDPCVPGPCRFVGAADPNFVQTAWRTPGGQEVPLSFASFTDAIPPKVTISAPTEGAKIAEHKVVKASYTCSDTGGSGLSSCIGTVAKGSPVDTTTLGPHTLTVEAHDRAGNVTVLTRNYTVIDVTAPLVVLNVPTAGATFDRTSSPSVNADYACFDAGSGIAVVNGCVGTVPSGSPIDTSTIGNKNFSVTAKDNSGNTTKVTASYKVVYPWNGFVGLADVPAMNPSSVAAGQKLPVVFDLGGNQGLPVTTSAKSTQVDCGTGALMGASASATGTTSYTAGTGKYTYLWTTKSAWLNTCRQFSLKLKDGTEHVVNFDF